MALPSCPRFSSWKKTVDQQSALGGLQPLVNFQENSARRRPTPASASMFCAVESPGADLPSPDAPGRPFLHIKTYFTVSLSTLPSECLTYSTPHRDASNSPAGACLPSTSHTEFFQLKLHSEGLRDENWEEEETRSGELGHAGEVTFLSRLSLLTLLCPRISSCLW